MAKSAKGGTWERKIARTITMWISGQDTELYCWRTPGSGSMHSTANLSNKAMSGDLMPLKMESLPLFDVFSLECKNGYPGTNPLLTFGNMKTNDLRDFWVQAVRDATTSDKLPMLIYNPPGKRPALVGLSPEGISTHFNKASCGASTCVFTRFNKDLGLPDLFLFDMKEFFEITSWKDYLGTCK